MSKKNKVIDTLPVSKEMVDLARDAFNNAYAPYSNHTVGVCIRSESGKLFSGCNVENSALPQGICAEENAVGSLIASGDKQIVEFVLVGPYDNPCFPCGGCRQTLREFAAPNLILHIFGPTKLLASYRFIDLLPFSFGPDNLQKDK